MLTSLRRHDSRVAEPDGEPGRALRVQGHTLLLLTCEGGPRGAPSTGKPPIGPRPVSFPTPLISRGCGNTECGVTSPTVSNLASELQFLKGLGPHQSCPQVSFATSAVSCVSQAGPRRTGFCRLAPGQAHSSPFVGAVILRDPMGRWAWLSTADTASSAPRSTQDSACSWGVAEVPMVAPSVTPTPGGHLRVCPVWSGTRLPASRELTALTHPAVCGGCYCHHPRVTAVTTMPHMGKGIARLGSVGGAGLGWERL